MSVGRKAQPQSHGADLDPLAGKKGLLNEDALDQRIAELDTKFHESLAVVKDLEGRMKANKELRYHVAAYASTKNVAQQLKAAKNDPQPLKNSTVQS